MDLLSWVVLGLIAGWVAGKVTDRPAAGCLPRIAVGIVGALVGGALARAAGYRGVDGVSLWSVFVAAIGATAFLLLLSAIEGGQSRGAGRRRRGRR